MVGKKSSRMKGGMPHTENIRLTFEVGGWGVFSSSCPILIKVILSGFILKAMSQ